MNGYANGWRAPADCRDVDFAFTPQSTARRAYLVSALVCLAAPRLRDRRLAANPAPPRAGSRIARSCRTGSPGACPCTRPRPSPWRSPCRSALLFALRTSLAIFPLLTLILWRGAGPRLLAGAAAVLFGIVTPLIYLIASPEDRGGFDFEYSLQVIYAHWVGVGGLVLLMAACWRALAAAHGRRGDTHLRAADRRAERATGRRAGAAPAALSGAPASSARSGRRA